MAAGRLGLMQLPGRLLYGLLRRRLRLEPALAVVFLFQSGAVLSLAWAGPGVRLASFAVVFGMANGMATLLRASAVAEAFGDSHYGRISGALSLLTACARAAGPIAAALAYQGLGSYTGTFAGLSALLALAAAAVLLPAAAASQGVNSKTTPSSSAPPITVAP